MSFVNIIAHDKKFRAHIFFIISECKGMQNFTSKQQMKAMEALAKKKEIDKKKDIAMLWRMLALLKIQDTLLPYRILYDLEKAESQKALKNDIAPGKYYPLEKLPNEVECLRSIPECKLDEQALMKLRKEMQIFEQEEAKYIINKDNWQYYFAHFLLPYDIDKFTEFDITGRTEKKVTDQELTKIKQYLSKVRQDCIEHPEKYYKGNVTVSCNGLSKREDNK